MPVNWFKAVFFAVFLIFLLFVAATYTSLFIFLRGSDLFSIFSSGTFIQPFAFSLLSSASAAALAGLITIPSAYVLSRCSFPGKELAEGILYLPVLVPPLVSGLALLLLFSFHGGHWLAEQGLRIVFSPAGAVVAQFFIAAPFALRTIKVAMEKVDPALEEAASTLGDSSFQVFTRVVLPLSRKGIAAGLLLAWARAMGEFGATIMLAGAYTRYTETLPVAIFLRFSTGELETAAAMAALMMLLSLIILVFTQRSAVLR